MGRLAIASCPPRFLVIRFEAGWYVAMKHEAYIRLVDPKTKGVRGNDNAHVARHECILDTSPILLRALAMIEVCADAPTLEPLGCLTGSAGRRHVDDPRTGEGRRLRLVERLHML